MCRSGTLRAWSPIDFTMLSTCKPTAGALTAAQVPPVKLKLVLQAVQVHVFVV